MSRDKLLVCAVLAIPGAGFFLFIRAAQRPGMGPLGWFFPLALVIAAPCALISLVLLASETVDYARNGSAKGRSAFANLMAGWLLLALGSWGFFEVAALLMG